MIRRLLILGLGLALAACASVFSDVEPPEVTLAGLSFAEPGLFEQELTVNLRLENPNEFDINVEGLQFALEVNELPFAKGRTRQNFELPSLGEVVVPVEVSVSTSELVERVMQLGFERRLEYRLTGEADLGGFGFGSLPFEREGKLAIPRIPGLIEPDT